jgi:hypothetical protein
MLPAVAANLPATQSMHFSIEPDPGTLDLPSAQFLQMSVDWPVSVSVMYLPATHTMHSAFEWSPADWYLPAWQFRQVPDPEYFPLGQFPLTHDARVSKAGVVPPGHVLQVALGTLLYLPPVHGVQSVG